MWAQFTEPSLLGSCKTCTTHEIQCVGHESPSRDWDNTDTSMLVSVPSTASPLSRRLNMIGIFARSPSRENPKAAAGPFRETIPGERVSSVTPVTLEPFSRRPLTFDFCLGEAALRGRGSLVSLPPESGSPEVGFRGSQIPPGFRASPNPGRNTHEQSQERGGGQRRGKPGA